MRSFGNYMQEWLYGEKGYYKKALIGQKGDFYTSVSLSKFFGGAVAFYIIKLLEEEKIIFAFKNCRNWLSSWAFFERYSQFFKRFERGRNGKMRIYQL